jgi:hypothetical protein
MISPDMSRKIRSSASVLVAQTEVLFTSNLVIRDAYRET